METSLGIKARIYAAEVHAAAGCTYGDKPYTTHLDMVENWVYEFRHIFRKDDDKRDTIAAAQTHDVIEDAQQTYNDVKDATSKEVADITLAVTDVHAENRMLRFLLTAPKIVKDHRSLILKVCDIGANGSYSRDNGSSMYKKYQKEWAGYKRNIFVTASKWYKDVLVLDLFDELIDEVDEILGNTP